MIDLLENMEMTNGLEAKDKLALQLIYDKEAIKSQFGKWTACPWTFKEREVKLFDPYNLYFFQKMKMRLISLSRLLKNRCLK